MHFKQSTTLRRVALPLVVSALAWLGASGLATAEGPVDPINLPGGVIVTDSDPGSGEQWARGSGRDIHMIVSDPSRFSDLSWGIEQATVPGAAFDNSIDGTVLATEYMSFDAGGSDLVNGIARWTGAARILLVASQAGAYVLPTRLTVTVTDHLHAAVPLSFVAGEVDPGVDIKNDTVGTINVNLLFEARYITSIPGGSMIGPGDGAWYPLLDLFDLLDTGAWQDGFAHTAVSTGFYYVLAGPGLSLEQHDQTVHDVLAQIHGDTDYLRIEVPPRLVDLETRMIDLAGLVIGVDGAVATVDAMARDASTNVLPYLATRDDLVTEVNELNQSLTEMVLLALGILPPGGTFPDDIDFGKVPSSGVAEQDSVDALQADVDDLAAYVMENLGAELQVDAVEITDRGEPRTRQWLVKTTRHGAQVDAELNRLLVIRSPRGELPTVEDLAARAVVTPLTTGLMEVTLEVAPGPGSDEADAYQFELILDDVVPAQGSALVAWTKRPL